MSSASLVTADGVTVKPGDRVYTSSAGDFGFVREDGMVGKKISKRRWGVMCRVGWGYSTVEALIAAHPQGRKRS